MLGEFKIKKGYGEKYFEIMVIQKFNEYTGATTLRITTLGITTLSIKGRVMTLSINDT
jgi:hypothetical protein